MYEYVHVCTNKLCVSASTVIFGLHFMYFIRHCFICLPWYSTLYDVAGIKPRARIFKLLRIPRIDSKESIPPAFVAWRASDRFFNQSVGTRNRVGIGLSYLGSILGLLKSLKIRAQYDNPISTMFLAPHKLFKNSSTGPVQYLHCQCADALTTLERRLETIFTNYWEGIYEEW